MVLALRFLAVGIPLAVVCVVRWTLHLIAVALFSVQDVLCINHGEQYIAQVLAVHIGTKHAQPPVDPLHRHLAHPFKNVIHTLRLGAVAHEWLVDHHGTESLLPFLLQYEDHLRY